jgi:hypothetical protein
MCFYHITIYCFQVKVKGEDLPNLVKEKKKKRLILFICNETGREGKYLI